MRTSEVELPRATGFPGLAEHIIEVSDVPPWFEFVGVESLHEQPMAGRSAGRKVPTGHVSCERMVTIAPKQVNEHCMSFP
jgi:hypothetical protein